MSAARVPFPAPEPPPARDGRSEGRGWLWAGTALFLALLLLPLAALAVSAGSATAFSGLKRAVVLDALRLSLATSATATLFSAALGLPVAYLLARHRFRGRELLDTLVDLPMTLPPVVAGLALLLAFGRAGLLGRYLEGMGIRIAFTTAAVVLAQTFMAAPFFIRAARAGFEAVPLELEQAAMTLGRNRWQVFWSISAPLAAPALAAGLVLAWARALSEFGATMLFAGNVPGVTQTMPLAVMSLFETDLELAAAVSLLSLALAFAALAGARLAARRWRP